MIKIIEQILEEDKRQPLRYDDKGNRVFLSKEERQFLEGWLAKFYSLKEQGIETTDTRKISLKALMNALGLEYG